MRHLNCQKWFYRLDFASIKLIFLADFNFRIKSKCTPPTNVISSRAPMAIPTILFHSHGQLPYFVLIISNMCLEYGHMCPNLLTNGQGYDGNSRFYAHEGFQALISDQYFIFKLDSHNVPAVLLYFSWSRVKFKSEIICINFKLYLWAGYWLVVPV